MNLQVQFIKILWFQDFENIESEWPIFYLYMIIDGFFKVIFILFYLKSNFIIFPIKISLGNSWASGRVQKATEIPREKRSLRGPSHPEILLRIPWN